MAPVESFQSETWAVHRQDDNGNRFVVEAGLTRSEAAGLAAELESHGHKQLYWIERDSSASEVRQRFATVLSNAAASAVIERAAICGALTMTPAEVVDAQLAAYNARNLAAFVATYAENACVYKPPEAAPLLASRAAIAEHYGSKTFQREGLRAEILHRLAVGDKVVDHERTWGLAPNPLDFVVVYEVRDELIQAVWLYQTESK